jgi:uncharacterized repeat protein (TIGR03803 family)
MRNERQTSRFLFESVSRGVHALLALTVALMLAAAITTTAQAQTYTVLYSFMGGTDGAYPAAGLIRDAEGILYGTTGENAQAGCTSYCGNVFRIDPDGNETTLHTFVGGNDGSAPSSGVVRDHGGNLYGTTLNGGKGAGSLGVVYKIDPAGRENILHYFPETPKDGIGPDGVVLDSEGNLYGTTIEGPGTGCGFGCGIIFKLDSAGKETITTRFHEKGYWEAGYLVRDAAGNEYGVVGIGGGTGCGGIGCGAVFKVDPEGKLSVVYAFRGGSDGLEPNGPVVIDKAGNLYGVTWEGGDTSACPPSGCGTVYKIDTTGKETVLRKFSLSDGYLPYGGLVLDSKGNLYGTTFAGGANCLPGGCGTVYKLDKAGKETVLYSFTGGTDGDEPFAGLVRDKAGNLYGTTINGGYTGGTGLCFPIGCGVVFKLTP